MKRGAVRHVGRLRLALAGAATLGAAVPVLMGVADPTPSRTGASSTAAIGDPSRSLALSSTSPSVSVAQPSPPPSPPPSPSPTPVTSPSPTPTTSANPSPNPSPVTCSLVIGFSQTRDWFTQFEAAASDTGLDPARWELLGAGGAGVNRWADPNNDVWAREIRSPCARNASAPERVVFTISAQIYQSDVEWWVGQIRSAVDQIRAHYPSARQIVLQPVVGGLNHERCVDPATNETIRATFNHAFIQQAIGRVVGGSAVRGADPHVESCAQYADAIGHLTDAGYAFIGRRLASFYSRFPNPS